MPRRMGQVSRREAAGCAGGAGGPWAAPGQRRAGGATAQDFGGRSRWKSPLVATSPGAPTAPLSLWPRQGQA